MVVAVDQVAQNATLHTLLNRWMHSAASMRAMCCHAAPCSQALVAFDLQLFCRGLPSPWGRCPWLAVLIVTSEHQMQSSWSMEVLFSQQNIVQGLSAA